MKISELVVMIYFIALICLLLPSYLVRFSIFGIPTTLLEVLICLAAILTLILKIKNKRSKIYPEQSRRVQTKNKKFSLLASRFSLPVFLFILAGVISVIIAPDKREALGLFKAYIFDPVLLFFVLIYNIKDRKQVDLLLKALILSGVLVALQAIWQKITGQLTPDGRVMGIFGYSPNYLALYLVPITVLVFGYEVLLINSDYSLRNYLSKKIWIYDLVLLVMLLALWFSGSRAAMIAVIIGAASFLVVKYWSWLKTKKYATLLLYCSIALLLIIGWQSIKANWQATPDSGRLSSSNNIRWEIWTTTVKDIIPKDNHWLLGVGLGSYQDHFTELTKDRINYPEWIAPMALTPHNLFLTIWLNLGLLGLVAFIWILILFFRLTSHKLSDISYLLFAVMITILIQGLVDTPYWKNDLSVMFWIFLALMIISLSVINGQYEKKLP